MMIQEELPPKFQAANLAFKLPGLTFQSTLSLRLLLLLLLLILTHAKQHCGMVHVHIL